MHFGCFFQEGRTSFEAYGFLIWDISPFSRDAPMPKIPTDNDTRNLSSTDTNTWNFTGTDIPDFPIKTIFKKITINNFFSFKLINKSDIKCFWHLIFFHTTFFSYFQPFLCWIMPKDFKNKKGNILVVRKSGLKIVQS